MPRERRGRARDPLTGGVLTVTIRDLTEGERIAQTQEGVLWLADYVGQLESRLEQALKRIEQLENKTS
jgi:ubiquinone biosynthesis protein UbiJ